MNLSKKMRTTNFTNETDLDRIGRRHAFTFWETKVPQGNGLKIRAIRSSEAQKMRRLRKFSAGVSGWSDGFPPVLKRPGGPSEISRGWSEARAEPPGSPNNIGDVSPRRGRQNRNASYVQFFLPPHPGLSSPILFLFSRGFRSVSSLHPRLISCCASGAHLVAASPCYAIHGFSFRNLR